MRSSTRRCTVRQCGVASTKAWPTTSRDSERNSRSYVSDTTVISQDIQTALIYKFSGISSQEQASVLASNSNKWNPAGIEYALRAQFPSVHRHHQRPPRPQRHERRTFAVEPKVMSGDSEAENEGFSDEKLNGFLDSKGSVQFQPGECEGSVQTMNAAKKKRTRTFITHMNTHLQHTHTNTQFRALPRIFTFFAVDAQHTHTHTHTLVTTQHSQYTPATMLIHALPQTFISSFAFPLQSVQVFDQL